MRRLGLLWILALSVVCAVGADYAQLTNLPTLYIETQNGRSITSRSTYILCRLIYVDGEDTTVYDSVEIRGRGNSTWGLAKKPYRIKFPEPIRFLGKGRAKARSLSRQGRSLLTSSLTAPFWATTRFPTK